MADAGGGGAVKRPAEETLAETERLLEENRRLTEELRAEIERMVPGEKREQDR